MRDLSKVDSTQIFDICKNIIICLLVLAAIMIFGKLLPFYCAPIVGLAGAAFLFTLLYNNKLRGNASCMMFPYSLFFCLLVYSFISILANVMYIWGWLHIPDEFIFFNDPYLPSLWFNPIMFFSLFVIFLRRKKLRFCIECRLNNGNHTDRGVFGSILNTESRVQLKNLLVLFGILTCVVWIYYLCVYTSINTNAKDRYVFFWISLIGIVTDIFYFLYRYYNLYLDLKENDELISPEEMHDMQAKTYLRYYVICDNKVYLNPESQDATAPDHIGIDTPYFTKYSADSVTTPMVQQTIRSMTGGKNGELRFFFGRKTPDIAKHIVLRFFYFLDGKPEDYTDMNAPGGWFDFEEVKMVYNQRPDLMATLAINDLTRLATIVITEKTYDEEGRRRYKLKHYKPSFDLIDVRDSNIDFQEDKWMKISEFNADKPFYKLRRMLQRLIVRHHKPIS